MPIIGQDPVPFKESNYLFSSPEQPVQKPTTNWQQNQFRNFLLERSSQYFGDVHINVKTYYHMVIAITKKILPSLAGHQEVWQLSSFLDNIFAEQAGHAGSIYCQIYAVKAGQPFHIKPKWIELFRLASYLWH
jgi:hypothetical protein